MQTLEDVLAELGPHAANKTAPNLPIDIEAIVILAREVVRLRADLEALRA